MEIETASKDVGAGETLEAELGAISAATNGLDCTWDSSLFNGLTCDLAPSVRIELGGCALCLRVVVSCCSIDRGCQLQQCLRHSVLRIPLLTLP